MSRFLNRIDAVEGGIKFDDHLSFSSDIHWHFL
jgi:hypothetical protein